MKNKLLINGALVDGAQTLAVINPATGETFTNCARADLAQLEDAVRAAANASTSWSALSYGERGAYLVRLAEALDARKDEACEIITREQGRPLAQAMMEVAGAVARLRFYAAQELPDQVLRENEKSRVIETYAPLGVVAVIVPWNFPLMLLVSKVAAALVVGNTVVAKPAPTTPLSALFFGEVAADILPAGTLNIIADASDLGDQLTSHPLVSAVSFTGSIETGRKVMKSGSAGLKRLSLELGGNDAAIVLDDADLPSVLPAIFGMSMFNAGQVCVGTKRIYVPRTRYDEACSILGQYAQGMVVGDGMQPESQMGPLQNRQQYERVLELISDASANGTVVAGGHPLDREGFFVAPTIVRDLPRDSRLIREEQFGPVVPVIAYDDLDELIEYVNETEHGLGGTIWTADVQRGMELAKRIQSGTVWINQGPDGAPDLPFGGAKQSGLGDRGITAFTQPKVIVAAL